MNNNAKILYVCQEVVPYLPENDISTLCRYLPQAMQERGAEIRIFMPRWGCINERRNQLHEVIRLSGMNLIIDDTDHQLIIKVASIPSARVQVYFIDNDDFFKRKATWADAEGKYFEDNEERAIFFARGVLETVKKLRWAPNIVHCHDWFTAIVPVYLRKIFHNDPIFRDLKIVVSVYDDPFPGELNADLSAKLVQEGIKKEDLGGLEVPDYTNLMKFAVQYADAVVMGSPEVDPELREFIEKSGKPVLPFAGKENYEDVYAEFYDKLLEK
ncbi:MAG: glycogen/starch synthase [Rikenellaceae bacterium]|nr:glycogen/starch synthase [Rikenellaceae bacterium]